MVMIRDEISVKGKISLYIAQRFGGRLVDNDASRRCARNACVGGGMARARPRFWFQAPSARPPRERATLSSF